MKRVLLATFLTVACAFAFPWDSLAVLRRLVPDELSAMRLSGDRLWGVFGRRLTSFSFHGGRIDSISSTQLDFEVGGCTFRGDTAFLLAKDPESARGLWVGIVDEKFDTIDFAPFTVFPMGIALSHPILAAGDWNVVRFFSVAPDGHLIPLSEIDVGDMVKDMAFFTNYLYVVAATAVLCIDVTDPLDPSIVWSSSDPAWSTVSALVGNEKLIVGDVINGFIIFDISVPSSPEYCATVSTGGGFEAAFWDEEHIVGATGGEVVLVDISDPYSPSLVSTIPMEGVRYAASSYEGVVTGTIGTGPGKGVWCCALDSLSLTLQYQTPGDAYRFVLLDTVLLAATTGGVRTFTDENLSERPSWAFDRSVYDILYAGGVFLAASGDAGLFSINQSGAVIDSYYVMGCVASDVDISDTVVLVAFGPQGALTLDLEPAGTLNFLGRFERPENATLVAAKGNYAFVWGDGKLFSYSIFSPRFPEILDSAEIPAARQMQLFGDTLWILSAGTWKMFDISDPGAITYINMIPLSEAGAVVEFDTLFVCTARTGISLRLGRLPTTQVGWVDIEFDFPPSDIVFWNDRFFVADSAGGIYVLGVPPPVDTGAVAEAQKAPKSIALKVYPNPFNSSVCLEIPAGASARVLDVTGRLVCKLVPAETREKGIRKLVWSPQDLPAGVYVVQVQQGEKTAARRILFIR